MQREIYKTAYKGFFDDSELGSKLESFKALVKNADRIFFLGNGGSNSISSHMMEDFGKMLRIPTYAFSDPSLITCYANDYGYEQAMYEWLKVNRFGKDDMLVAISSSGNSKNILNAASYAKDQNGKVVALSGFNANNSLRSYGDVEIHVPHESYGIVETLHQLIIHIVLDECLDEQ